MHRTDGRPTISVRKSRHAKAALRRAVRPTIMLVEKLEQRQMLAASEPIINEFMASNKTGITDNFGDNSAYMAIAAAIRKWDFSGIHVKHFWGLPYFMAALSKLTGLSDRGSLLAISSISSLLAVTLAYRLWGGWIAAVFATS